MWRKVLYIIPLLSALCSTNAIKVPVDNNDEPSTEAAPINYEQSDQESPSYYITDDANLDSYLVPPDPHKPNEELSGVSITPATYLLPPSPESPQDFYNPTEPGEQSDWYPITENQDQSEITKPVPIIIASENKKPRVKFLKNTRTGKGFVGEGTLIKVPSTHLEPPPVGAINDYILSTPAEELELPADKIEHPIRTQQPINNQQSYEDNPRKVPIQSFPVLYSPDSSLVLHLTPPKEQFAKHKTPTKLYPKKYAPKFRPVPIPIAQYAEDTQEIPRAKPLNFFKPLSSVETDYIEPHDEKKIYLYQDAKQNLKLKGEYEAPQQQPAEVDVAKESLRNPAPSEQEASETNYRYPESNVYSAPIRQPPSPGPQRASLKAAPAPEERTEFRMHGLKGPHSYQFGYDTGKGKNRQFRFEERDNDGIVHGHYGYMDKSGKMRVVNYSAHPELGFHAEAPVEKE